MSSVFGHGRLRLYLLKLLEEEPRHGYDIIRLLKDRFMGVYAPSAGTIYPRLSRLEDEGLVEHEVAEGKKVYRLTDPGRDELASRQDELAALERDIDRSVRDLAREVREDVRSSVRELREELKAAAREVRETEHTRRREGRHSGSSPWDEFADLPGWAEAKEAMREAKRAVKESAHTWQADWQKDWRHAWSEDTKRLVKDVLEATERLRAEVRQAVGADLDDDSLREVHATLQGALAQVRDLHRG